MTIRRVGRIIALLTVILVGVGQLWLYRAIMAGRGDPDMFDLFHFRRAVQAQVNGSTTGYAVIVGDSIAANAPTQTVCGRSVVVAAVNGGQLRHILDDIFPLLQRQRPAQLVIAVGVNETKRLVTTPRAERLAVFTRDYRQVLIGAKALTAATAVVLIPPVAKIGFMGDNVFDATLIAAFNRVIEILAADLNVPVFALTSLAGPDGFAREDATVDGVHPTPAGYAIWMEAVEQAWHRIQTCPAG
jgi:lysophospholipase L1-like esterase